MRKVNALIVRAAGTNCDRETAYAFELAGAQTETAHINRLIEGERRMGAYDILVIPGGFSFGDDVAAGKILAVSLMRELGEDIRAFVAAKKPVLGICNGFQALVRMGLLPNLDGKFAQTAALTENDTNRYEDRWVHLKCVSKKCIFTSYDSIVEYPVAHGEGKFVAKDEALLDALFDNGQVVYRYADSRGNPGPFPVNPNGSPRDIAAVCDPGGTVLGLMPHPERHVFGYQHPRWTREGLKEEGDGLALFRNAVEYVKKNI
jgi:phosphoribosylformylglycinamidine synthase